MPRADGALSPASAALRLALTSVVGLLGAVAACGADSPSNKDYGQPPDASTFDPGEAGPGEPYGSGSQTGGGGQGGAGGGAPFVCPDELKRCPHDFTLPYNGEATVELRGDYRPGAWDAGNVLARSGSTWRVTVDIPYNKDVLYKFWVNGNHWVNDPSSSHRVSDGFGGQNDVLDAATCNFPKCDEPPVPPPGVFDWRDAVLYFVFVDRFNNGSPGNDCHVAGADGAADYKGGDWVGVTNKINDGYFTDLGVNTLWITVPLENATVAGKGIGGDSHMYSAYHGYWPTDVASPESCFGTKGELTAMVQAAHAKGLKVLFDYAMVHVHTQSQLWKDNPDWFWPNQNPNDSSKNCICGDGCSWDTDYQRCWFADYLPHWNYTVQKARDFSVAAAVKWVTDTGIDGFRLDAIKHVDGSWLTELRSQIQSGVVAKESPPQRFYMVGETYDFENVGFIKSFVDPVTKLDGQFDFPLRERLVQATLTRQLGMDGLAAFMDKNEFAYGVSSVMSTFAGNHDLPRIIHLGEDKPLWNDQGADGKDRSWSNPPTLPQSRSPFERVANAFGVLLTNKGAPLLYYGDEIGMPGAGDPDNRRVMSFTGWSSDQSWLHDRIKTLAAIRASHPALRRGHRTNLQAPSGDVWTYSMSTQGDTVYVAINRGDSPASIGGLPGVALKELVEGGTQNGSTASVPARQTRIWSP